jgi:hypothetical protein
MRQPLCAVLTAGCLMSLSLGQRAEDRPVPFTQGDKERLIRIEVTLEQFMKATDRR